MLFANSIYVRRLHSPRGLGARGTRAAWSVGRRRLDPPGVSSMRQGGQGEEVGGPRTGAGTPNTTHDFENTAALTNVDYWEQRMQAAEKKLWDELYAEYYGER